MRYPARGSGVLVECNRCADASAWLSHPLAHWRTPAAGLAPKLLDGSGGRRRNHRARWYGGAVSLFYTDPTFLVVDVNGYFVDSPADLAFFPLKPCRVIDSRLFASFAPIFRAGQSRRVGMLSTCGVPASAQAYSLNLTAVADPGQPLGFLTAYPTGSPRPTVSTLNAGNGEALSPTQRLSRQAMAARSTFTSATRPSWLSTSTVTLRLIPAMEPCRSTLGRLAA